MTLKLRPTGIPLYFQEEKATQVAGLFLQLGGGRMNLMRLVKLMYLADREALVRWGRPVTMDTLCSMPRGPVLSNTLNLINEQPDPENPRYWHQYISERHENYEVELRVETKSDQLSRKEEQVVEEVFSKFGHLSQWQLVDYTHTLPEWKDPAGSMFPIDIRDILLPAGYTEQDVLELKSELQHISQVHRDLV